MLGNAIELCEDLYHADYSGAPDDGSAWIEEDSYTFRISRGGSFDLGAGVCTSSSRFYEIPEEHQHYLGFRLARTANP
jgi:formylglycine-generating enzyme required for sulfatase activity